VVVHKLDRFARDAAHHLAVRAALRQRGVRLVSVQEQLEATASGRLVEGIHALMAEFYSANLSNEVKKGMKQKVEMGGWTHRAPLGYFNVREWAGGRRVSYVAPDPERAELVRLAFELYASGEYTQEALLDELRSRGLTNRGRKDYPVMPITTHGLSWLLTNKFYLGLVEWQGVELQGRPRASHRLQDVLQGPGDVRQPRRPGRPRGQAPPLPEGDAGLRGLRPGPVDPAFERAVCLLLLPRTEGPAPAHRLSRGVHPG